MKLITAIIRLFLISTVVALLATCGGGGSSTGTPTPSTVQLDPVSALFPINGADLNDYLSGDASTATDVACVVDTDIACLHGGERRVVVATGKTDCTGLTAMAFYF